MFPDSFAMAQFRKHEKLPNDGLHEVVHKHVSLQFITVYYIH